MSPTTLLQLIPYEQLPEMLLSVIAFSFVGIVLFSLAFLIISRVSPFSIRKEIETDQNVALAIIIGSVIIGIAMIVAAAVHG